MYRSFPSDIDKPLASKRIICLVAAVVLSMPRFMKCIVFVFCLVFLTEYGSEMLKAQITSSGGIEQHNPVPPFKDLCASAQANQTYFVPEHFSGDSIPSKDGSYYYPVPGNNGCNSWVVDVKISHQSNTNGNPGSDGKLFLSGESFDLPSSLTTGISGKPSTKIDCLRYLRKVQFFKKDLASSQPFTWIGYGVFTGTWRNSGCNISRSQGTLDNAIALAPAVGVEVYRVVVSMTLREVAQKAAVEMQEAQAPQGPP